MKRTTQDFHASYQTAPEVEFSRSYPPNYSPIHSQSRLDSSDEDFLESAGPAIVSEDRTSQQSHVGESTMVSEVDSSELCSGSAERIHEPPGSEIENRQSVLVPQDEPIVGSKWDGEDVPALPEGEPQERSQAGSTDSSLDGSERDNAVIPDIMETPAEIEPGKNEYNEVSAEQVSKTEGAEPVEGIDPFNAAPDTTAYETDMAVEEESNISIGESAGPSDYMVDLVDESHSVSLTTPQVVTGEILHSRFEPITSLDPLTTLPELGLKTSVPNKMVASSGYTFLACIVLFLLRRKRKVGYRKCCCTTFLQQRKASKLIDNDSSSPVGESVEQSLNQARHELIRIRSELTQMREERDLVDMELVHTSTQILKIISTPPLPDSIAYT